MNTKLSLKDYIIFFAIGVLFLSAFIRNNQYIDLLATIIGAILIISLQIIVPLAYCLKSKKKEFKYYLSPVINIAFLSLIAVYIINRVRLILFISLALCIIDFIINIVFFNSKDKIFFLIVVIIYVAILL